MIVWIRPKAQKTKVKIDKWNYAKLKTSTEMINRAGKT
jgi:hypothetical protein